MCQERLQRVRALQAELLSEPNRTGGASPEGVVPSKGLTNFHPFYLDLFSFHLLRVSLLKKKRYAILCIFGAWWRACSRY